jgi:hypothetical protein
MLVAISRPLAEPNIAQLLVAREQDLDSQHMMKTRQAYAF